MKKPIYRAKGCSKCGFTGYKGRLGVYEIMSITKEIKKLIARGAHDLEIEEAAVMDGCSKFQVYTKIIVPMLKPIIVTVTILNGIWIWNDYMLPFLVLGKGNAIQTLPLAVSNFVGAYTKQWDMILCSAFLAIVPVLIFFLFAQKQIMKGMVEGAVKS